MRRITGRVWNTDIDENANAGALANANTCGGRRFGETGYGSRKYVALMLAVVLLLFGAAPDGADAPLGDQLNWYSMTEAQQLATDQEKKVLVYAEASWCTYCNKIEKEVFPEQDVQQVVSKYFYPVKVDIESDNIITYNNEDMTEQEFSRFMRVSATPTFLFIDGEGNVLGGQPGYMPADVFKALLTYVGSDAFSRVKFDDFYENEYQNR